MKIGDYCYRYRITGERILGKIFLRKGEYYEVIRPNGDTNFWHEKEIVVGNQQSLKDEYIKEVKDEYIKEAVWHKRETRHGMINLLPPLPSYSGYLSTQSRTTIGDGEFSLDPIVTTTPNLDIPQDKKYLSNKFNFLTINQDE